MDEDLDAYLDMEQEMEDEFVPDDIDAMVGDYEDMEEEDQKGKSDGNNNGASMMNTEGEGKIGANTVVTAKKGADLDSISYQKSSIFIGTGATQTGMSGALGGGKAKLLPSDIAKSLQQQKAQKAALNGQDNGASMDASALHTKLSVTPFLTQQESIPALSSSSTATFLHSRPQSSTITASGGDSSSRTCVLANGQRVFLGVKASADSCSTGNGNKGNSSLAHRLQHNLLARPISELQEEARLIQVEATAKRAQTEQMLKERLERGFEGSSTGGPSGDHQDGAGSAPHEHDQGLWVNTHAPQTFSQLLSSERTNREVLRGVKMWDKFVFKTDTNPNPSQKGSNGMFGGTNGNSGTSGVKADPAAEEKADNNSAHAQQAASSDDGRPLQKVILLCGPPGTGKTTLAHIVAKHCGYRPMEINASDDRTSEVLKDHVNRAMNSNTITGDRRPNCIILDEIDGIDNRASIDTLVNIIKAPLRSSKKKHEKAAAAGDDGEEEEENEKEKSKGRSSGVGSSIAGLSRPMICICNDQYTPVLRELRRHCQVFVFQPPAEARLISRLNAICSVQKLTVRSESLRNLCHASGGDIRSSINTLQFAASRASSLVSGNRSKSGEGKDISTAISAMITRGLKDESKDVFQVWKECFSQQEVNATLARKNKLKEQASKGKTPDGSFTRGPLMEVMQGMADYGDSDLVLRGIFHNVLHIRYNDPSMTRSAIAAEWFSYVETFQAYAFSGNGDFQLMPYVPAASAAVHMLCSAEAARPKLEWPSVDRDQRYKQKQNENILSTMQEGEKQNNSGIALGLSGLSPMLRSHRNVVMDVLGAALHIITPKVRPLALVALSPAERAGMAHSVKAMASLGLTFSLQRMAQEGFKRGGYGYNNNGPQNADYSLVLEPSLDQLVRFDFATSALCGENSALGAGGAVKNPTGQAGPLVPVNVSHRAFLSEEVKSDMLISLQRHILQFHENEREIGSAGVDRVLSPSSAKHQKQQKVDTPSLTRSPAKAKALQSPTSTGVIDSPSRGLRSSAKRRAADAEASSNDLESQRSKLGSGEEGKEVKEKEKAGNGKGKQFPVPTKFPSTEQAKGRALDEAEELAARKSQKTGGGFFVSGGGRNSVIKKNDKLADERKQRLLQTQGAVVIRFKFNQGFSNAVKRPVSIAEFI